MQTRSTLWIRFSNISPSRVDKSVTISTFTRGFRLSILGLATSSLCERKYPDKLPLNVRDRNIAMFLLSAQHLHLLKKKPQPRSSSLIFSWSTIISFPMPASTIFLIASVATPRSCSTSITAFLILSPSIRAFQY